MSDTDDAQAAEMQYDMAQKISELWVKLSSAREENKALREFCIVEDLSGLFHVPGDPTGYRTRRAALAAIDAALKAKGGGA